MTDHEIATTVEMVARGERAVVVYGWMCKCGAREKAGPYESGPDALAAGELHAAES